MSSELSREVEPTHATMQRQYLRILALITVIGFALRIIGIAWRSFHPDENNIARIALKMVQTGSAEPDKMNYGTLPLYLQAAVLSVVSFLQEAAGFTPEVKVGQGVIVGRSLSLLASVMTILVCAGIGRSLVADVHQQAGNRAPESGIPTAGVAAPSITDTQRATVAGLIAACAFSFSFLSVQCAHYATVDGLVTLLISSSLYFTLQAYHSHRAIHFVAAGVLAGLATATKYTGVLVAAPLAVLALLPSVRSDEHRTRLWKYCLVGLACVPIFFLLAMPYALLKFEKLIAAIQFESHHYQTGGETIFAMGEHTWLWNLQFLYATALGPGLFLMSCAGLFIAWSDGTQRQKLLLPTLYLGLAYLFISRYKVRFDRNLLPMLPFLCAFAGVWAANVWRLRARWIRTLLVIAVTASLLYPLSRGVVFDWQLHVPHTKAQFRDWRNTHLTGAKIAEHGRKLGFPLRHYQRRGFDYLIMSTHSLEPVAAHPEQFPRLYENYRDFFARCEVVAVFRNPWFDSDFFAPHSLLNSATVNAYHGPTLWVLKVPRAGDRTSGRADADDATHAPSVLGKDGTQELKGSDDGTPGSTDADPDGLSTD